MSRRLTSTGEPISLITLACKIAEGVTRGFCYIDPD